MDFPRFVKSLQNTKASLKILILCDFHLRNPDLERMGEEDRREFQKLRERKNIPP
jgi:hypothetical protein